jgi:uncharacterized membrane protein
MQAHLRQHEEPLPDLSERLTTEGTLLDCGNVLYVHLISGRVIEVAPVTSVQLTSHAVLALNGNEVVRSFPRDSVFFATDQVNEPPYQD